MQIKDLDTCPIRLQLPATVKGIIAGHWLNIWAVELDCCEVEFDDSSLDVSPTTDQSLIDSERAKVN